MSIEYYAALKRERIPDAQAFNDAARIMDVPVEVQPNFDDLSSYGFRPVRFRGADTGVELGLYSLDEVSGNSAEFDERVSGRADSVLVLTFGSDPREGAVAMGMCAVLSRIAEVLVFSTEDGCFVNEAELMGLMREFDAAVRDNEVVR